MSALSSRCFQKRYFKDALDPTTTIVDCPTIFSFFKYCNFVIRNKNRFSTDSNMNKEIFYVGQMFPNKEEVLCFFREFCKIYSQPLTIRDSSEKKVVFKCCHGRRRKSVCTGQRPIQHCFFKSCEVQINVFKNKENYWKVTKVNLQHNHETGRVQYEMYGRKRKLDDEDYKLMSDLLEAKAKDSIIAEVIKKKRDKFLTRRDVQNIRYKLFTLISKEKEAELKKFLIEVIEENGKCMISYEDDNTVKALFITTNTMIECLQKSKPTVIQIDVSFGFSVENYKLLGFCYYSSVTGKSEFAALAFILRETKEIIKECVEEFRGICISDALVFLVDKDFAEISAIREVFPLGTILLCKFHVLKYIKKLLSSAFACHTATKENIFIMFKKVLYSRSEEEYEERKFDLLIMANEIEVSVGNKYVFFNDQFNKNWDSCKEMWVHCYRKNLPLMGDSTTNRIERSFWTLKNYIRTNFHGTPSICESVISLVNFITKSLNDKICFMAQKVFKIVDKNPRIRALLESASLKVNETGLKLLHESLVKLEALKSNKPGNTKELLETCNLYSTTINSCKCEFRKSHEAPCQHILLLRENLNTELCLEKCFHERYLLTEHNLEMNEESVEDTTPKNVNIHKKKGNNVAVKTLTEIEKFKKVSSVTQEINELVKSHGTKKFLEYLEELEKFKTLVRQGESVAMSSLSSKIQINKRAKSPESSNLDSNLILKFQEKVKCKGRPKRNSKQLTFKSY